MDELTIGDKIYISSKQAAKITGYAKDYVGQLCREGRVEAKLVGRNWYVLESSIRAHRFGPESKPEPVTIPEEAPAQVVSRQWEASTYVSVEPEALIPAITPVQKPQPAPETTEAVALMQDAWKEWFAAREQSTSNQEVVEEAISEPEQEDQIEEDVTTEEVRASDISSIYNVSEVSHMPEEEEVAVPLTRVIEDDVEEYEPVVPLHVVRPASSSYSEPRSAKGVVDLSHAYEEQYVPQEPVQRMRRGRVQRRGQGTLTMQALFVSIAGLAIVVAIIGSGALDSVSSVQGINDSLRGAIFDTLRGETVIKK